MSQFHYWLLVSGTQTCLTASEGHTVYGLKFEISNAIRKESYMRFSLGTRRKQENCPRNSNKEPGLAWFAFEGRLQLPFHASFMQYPTAACSSLQLAFRKIAPNTLPPNSPLSLVFMLTHSQICLNFLLNKLVVTRQSKGVQSYLSNTVTELLKWITVFLHNQDPTRPLWRA